MNLCTTFSGAGVAIGRWRGYPAFAQIPLWKIVVICGLVILGFLSIILHVIFFLYRELLPRTMTNCYTLE